MTVAGNFGETVSEMMQDILNLIEDWCSKTLGFSYESTKYFFRKNFMELRQKERRAFWISLKTA